MTMSCQLHPLGAYAPERIITNDDISLLVDTSHQWIMERTGIGSRHQLEAGQNTSTLGLEASRIALEKAGLEAKNLTHIMAATCTPDHLAPSVACMVAGALDAGPVMAFDMGAACTGFIYGLSLCRSILAMDPESKILLICAEALTRRVNWRDRSTCVLFGDAAAASVVDRNSEGAVCEVLDVICQSDGALKDLIIVGGGTSCQYEVGGEVGEDFFISMRGRETYKHAVRHISGVCEELLERNNLSIDDVDLFVPHQANMRIIEAIGSRLRLPSGKVFTNLKEYGNTSSASIPLALAQAMQTGQIRPGCKVLVGAFGSGLTWGAALLGFHEGSI